MTANHAIEKMKDCMPKADIPANEKERLKALRSYNILDTLSEAEYDAITDLASYICETPIALVSLIDEERQWFKARTGLDAAQTHRDLAFCAHAILNPREPLVVEDATKDKRFAQNDLVTGAPDIRFYAGYPLNTPDGFPLGTLCAIDTKPRTLSSRQLEMLKALADNVVALLELRKAHMEKEKLIAGLNRSNEELEEFSYRVSHDLRAPLASLSGLAKVAVKSIECGDYEKALHSLSHCDGLVAKLLSMIDDLLALTKMKHGFEERVLINLDEMIDDILSRLCHSDDFGSIEIIKDIALVGAVSIQKTRLQMILENLISNAIKYQDHNKKQSFCKISAYRKKSDFVLEVEDNGIGFPQKRKKDIFSMFTRFHPDVSYGSGLGLYMVKKSALYMNGEIQYHDTVGGSLIRLVVPLDD